MSLRQVPVARSSRSTLIATSRSELIPALLLDEGTSVAGETAIHAYLDEHLTEPPGAESQRQNAEAHSPPRSARRGVRARIHPLFQTRRHFR